MQQDIYPAITGNLITYGDSITSYGGKSIIKHQNESTLNPIDDFSIISGEYDSRFDDQRYYYLPN